MLKLKLCPLIGFWPSLVAVCLLNLAASSSQCKPLEQQLFGQLAQMFARRVGPNAELQSYVVAARQMLAEEAPLDRKAQQVLEYFKYLDLVDRQTGAARFECQMHDVRLVKKLSEFMNESQAKGEQTETDEKATSNLQKVLLNLRSKFAKFCLNKWAEKWSLAPEQVGELELRALLFKLLALVPDCGPNSAKLRPDEAQSSAAKLECLARMKPAELGSESRFQAWTSYLKLASEQETLSADEPLEGEHIVGYLEDYVDEPCRILSGKNEANGSVLFMAKSLAIDVPLEAQMFAAHSGGPTFGRQAAALAFCRTVNLLRRDQFAAQLAEYINKKRL